MWINLEIGEKINKGCYPRRFKYLKYHFCRRIRRWEITLLEVFEKNS
jgi:hypothetical protein